MRTALFLLMALGSGVSVSACGAPLGGIEEPAPETLLPSLQVSAEGREVGFVLQLTNTAQQPLDIAFDSGQSFDFIVLQGDREVWRWSEDQAFTQALREERVEGGASLRYEALWRPADTFRGDFVAIGRFTARDYGIEQTTGFTLP